MKPKLLDLFCGAGGASKGYADAGFEVIGVDIKPQPRYPYVFVQWDALDYINTISAIQFDAVHASPPCQAYSVMTNGRWKDRVAGHDHLIAAVREALVTTSKPYVIENVSGARAEMRDPIMLCGTMFGLQTSEGSQLRRHRLFELSWGTLLTPQCAHNDGSAIGVYGGGQHPSRRRPATIGVWGNSGGKSVRDGLDHYGIDARREAMGIEWMTGKELTQAIPPAYTEFIGKYLLEAL